MKLSRKKKKDLMCMNRKTCKVSKVISINVQKGVVYHLKGETIHKSKLKDYIIYEEEKGV